MVRRASIPALVLLLLVQMMAPVCMAAAAAGRAGVAASAPQRPGLPADDAPQEVCWVEASHLFKKAVMPYGTGGISLCCLVLSSAAVVALVAQERPYVCRQWLLPDRAPPTQPLLQVFRI